MPILNHDSEYVNWTSSMTSSEEVESAWSNTTWSGVSYNSTAGTVRHVTSSVQSLLTFSYFLGICGNVAALVILGRHETQRNKRQTLMLRCLSYNDLLALVGSLVQMYLHLYLPREWVVNRLFCGFRVFWRAFGLGSGCVALVMAVERWLALSHPFFYQKQVTYQRILMAIFLLWTWVTILACLPFVGFGLYYDTAKADRFKCTRYRFATKTVDVAYAYVVLGFGMLMCLCIVICNLCVIHALCQMGKRSAARRRVSRHSLGRETEAGGGATCHDCSHRRVSLGHDPASNRNYVLINNTGNKYRRRDSSYTQCSQEEISFARLMAVLCIFYVVCWLPQLLSIAVGQWDVKNQDRLFFRVADVFIALNFVLDPFIYVVLRATNGCTCLGSLKNFLYCKLCTVSSHHSEGQPTVSSTVAAPETNLEGSSEFQGCSQGRKSTSSVDQEYVPLQVLLASHSSS